MTNTQGFINDLKAATRLSDDPTLEHMLELAEAVEQDLQDMANKNQKQKPSINPKIDELDKILSEYEIGFITHGKNVDGHLRDFKQPIQTHINKKINKILNKLNKEIFFSSANPDGQLVKNLILNKRRTIKKLRSEL